MSATDERYAFRITQEGPYVGVMPAEGTPQTKATSAAATRAATLANAYIGGYQLEGFDGLGFRPDQNPTAPQIAIAALGRGAVIHLMPQMA